MGASKSDQFSKKHNQMANVLKALAHPARVAIVEYLLSVDACICGDIVDDLPLSQSTVSQHLKELKEAGLIKGNIEGASVCYCIDEKEWIKAQIQMNVLFEKMEVKSAKCCSWY